MMGFCQYPIIVSQKNIPKKDNSLQELNYFLSQNEADLYIFPEGFLDSNDLQDAIDIIREKEKYVTKREKEWRKNHLCKY